MRQRPGFHDPGPSLVYGPLNRTDRIGATRVSQIALESSGPAADQIGRLTWTMTVMGAVIAVGVFAVLFRGLWRSGTDDTDHSEEGDRSSRWLIGGGLALPAVAITVVFGLSLAAMRSMPLGGTTDAMVIDVSARQFWWEISYPGTEAVTANEIHIPVDTPVEFRLRSEDVIHSFWVPALGGKMDALPDYTNSLVLEADEPGTYEGSCAEFCGLGHAHMGLAIIAEPQAEYEEWLERQAAPADPPTSPEAVEGRSVFEIAECGECHTIRGTASDGEVGPDLTHLAGRSMLAARTFPNQPDRLRSWILDPHAIKAGAEMEPTPLDEADLDALIAYLETLR